MPWARCGVGAVRDFLNSPSPGRAGLTLVAGVKGIKGVILSDQLRSLDWEALGAKKAGKAADDVLTDVLAKLKVLLTVR